MPFVLLDSGPLGIILNPNNKTRPIECRQWVENLVNNEIPVIVPEIIDYEIRRELIQSKNIPCVERLDSLGDMGLSYDPITTEITNRAANLWAWARNTNQQTAHNQNIDIDVFLAAHAIILAEKYGEFAVIATSNTRHIKRYTDLERYTKADNWENITVEVCYGRKVSSN